MTSRRPARPVHPDYESVVRPDGALPSAARRLLPTSLCEYARAFTLSSLAQVRFLWWAPKSVAHTLTPGWQTVSMERNVDGTASIVVAATSLPNGITDREIDVLSMIAIGLSNAQAAERLGTRPRTVSTQVESLLSKLEQATRSGLAALAIDSGLIRLPLPDDLPGEGGPSVVVLERLHRAPTTSRPTTPPLTYARKRPFRLGTVAPSKGASEDDGLETLRGATLAVAEINASGGIGGRMIEHVVVETDFFDDEAVHAAYEELIEQDVDAATSSYVTAEHPDVLEAIADAGIIFLHTASFEQHVELVREKPGRYGLIFQTCPSETHYGTGAVRFLRALSQQSAWRPRRGVIASIEVANPGWRTTTEAMREAADAAGWSVVEVAPVALGKSDWSDIIAQLQAVDAAAVIVGHFLVEDMVHLQSAIEAAHLPLLVYYIYGASIPAFSERLPGRGDGVLWSSVTGTYDDALGRGFRQRYAQHHGVAPGWSQAGAAYDQVRLLATSWSMASRPDPELVARHLRQTPQRGVNGIYYFGDAGQSSLTYPDASADLALSQAHLVFQIQGGTHRVLGPEPFGRASSFVMPPWFPR